ncbi:MAG: hypothetical protein ABI867_12970 [Kofleriaceae bacterium]
MTPTDLAAKLTVDPDYVATPPVGEDLAYLESLALPVELAAFYRTHAPATTIGSRSLLLSIEGMREEHKRERSHALRELGCIVIATANRNPYFCVRTTGEIRLADEQDLADADFDLAAVLEHSKAGPVFAAFADFLDAFAAGMLPSSPYERVQVHVLRTWQENR